MGAGGDGGNGACLAVLGGGDSRTGGGRRAGDGDRWVRGDDRGGGLWRVGVACDVDDGGGLRVLGDPVGAASAPERWQHKMMYSDSSLIKVICMPAPSLILSEAGEASPSASNESGTVS